MEGPSLRIGREEPDGRKRRNEWGYQIGDTDAAVKEALNRVLEYLRSLRRAGAETRGWTQSTVGQLEEKLVALRRISKGESPEAMLSDLLAWEGHILQVIRHYMQEVSDTMNRIKTLNPPLTTNQLRPFLQAVEDDRTATIQALTPITQAIEKIAQWKATRFGEGRPKNAA